MFRYKSPFVPSGVLDLPNPFNLSFCPSLVPGFILILSFFPSTEICFSLPTKASSRVIFIFASTSIAVFCCWVRPPNPPPLPPKNDSKKSENPPPAFPKMSFMLPEYS